MSWTGFAKPAAPMKLSQREQREVTENFLQKPCIRCNDSNHSCSNCNNLESTHPDGPYGMLGAGKKQTANKLIDDLKKKYAANPEDLIFKTYKKEGVPQKKAPVKHAKQAVPGPSDQQATSISQSSSLPPTSHVTQTSNIASSDGSEKRFGYPFHYELEEITAQGPPTPRGNNKVYGSLDRNASHVDLNRLKDRELDYPTRTTFINIGKNSKVLTNHFQLTCNLEKPVTLYEYKIPEIEGKGKRKMRAMMQSIIAHCPVLTANRVNFATDYSYTIIAWTDLGEQLHAANHTMTVAGTYHLLNLSDGSGSIPVSLEFMRQIDMRDLFRYAQMDPTLPSVNAEDLTRLFNIIVSEGAERSNFGVVPGGGNKYYRKDGHVPLGNGRSLCTHRGYSYSVRAGVGAVLLNVSKLTSVFWSPSMFHMILDDDDSWRTTNFNSFEGLIVGLRVYITYERGDKKKDPDAYERLNSREGRIRKIAGLGKSAKEQMFIPQGGNTPISVADHFAANYPAGFLTRPDLQVVNLGERNDPRWYPAEKLKVVAYQKFKALPPSNFMDTVKERACKDPEDSMALVQVEGLQTLGVNNLNNVVAPFPTCHPLELRPALLEVDAYTLRCPVIGYGNQKSRDVGVGGHWNLRDVSPYQLKNASFRALVVHKSQVTAQNAGLIFKNLATWTQRYSVAQLQRIGPSIVFDPSLDKRMQDTHAQHRDVNMAVLVVENRDIAAYQTFKDLCDRKYGLHAICLAQSRMSTNAGVGGFWGNVILKMNLKAAGINHAIHGGIGMADKLILGADVTHPGAGSVPGCPSIASIVGSVDRHAGRFLGSMRIQKKSRSETIDEVEAMVFERMQDWINEMSGGQKLKTLPNEIYYYRDGVSESQYAAIKQQELPAIRRAWASIMDRLQKAGLLDFKHENHVPKLVAVICGKRHHVRFYPKNKKDGDRGGNCHPGTTVDDVVTSPYYQDFYLQSHAALAGTARSCHYFVIENEPNISLHDLRQFTHNLCYTYVRSTTGVSYASPAYYADRLCERGRCYLRDYYTAPKNSQVRNDFNNYRNVHEQNFRNQRLTEFGPRVPGTKKTPKEQAREKEHRLAVERLCDQETMKRARDHFYQFKTDKTGNPWQPRLQNTMFWM